jgi:hypothetical protein
MNAGPLRRIGYTFLGLLAGNASLLLWSLGNALRIREEMLRLHRGSPNDQISVALQLSLVYFVFSIGGWMLAGIPLALAIPARVIARMSGWTFLLGAVSGPISLFMVFSLIPNGHFNWERWRGGMLFWIYAALIATVASAVYHVLLRRRLAEYVEPLYNENGAP